MMSCSAGSCSQRPAPKVRADVVPRYSTDPAASKQLRDKMWADGWWCQIRNGWTLDDPKCWAGFTPHGVTGWNGRPDNWTEADTEEMAVALAALSAVGKPVAL